MESSISTDRFKLDSLPQPHDRASRPTIPYSQFPRPALPHVSTSFDNFSRLKGIESIPNASITESSTSPHNLDYPMDSITASGHRRRRSSLMNSLDGGPGANRTEGTQATHKGADWSEDDGRGPVDADSGSEDLESLLEEEGLNDDEETGLTEPERRRRKGMRRRNSMLDQRIAGHSNVTLEERKEANQHLLKKIAINGFLIGLWYLFSLSISLYNTWMFSSKHLDFSFPLFTTSMHMLVQFTLASLVLYFLPSFRPRYNSISNEHNIHNSDADRARHKAKEKEPLMSKWFYFTRLGPCGMATGLDIGLGNTSLKFISLTFYTMCKSSSLAFVLMFAFIFRLETPSWRLVAIIATMTVGVVMMVFGEVDFSALGFILVISAAFFSGFRWGLTQILLLRNPATSNPFSTIFFLAPIMFLTLLLLAIPIEGISKLAQAFGALVAAKGIFIATGTILFPGVIAFLMTASEFALLKRTSVVTLSIAGIFKEVVTIGAAGLIFEDKLTPINVSGLFVTIGAIAAYNYIKITKMREDAIQKVHTGHTVLFVGGPRDGTESIDDEGVEWEMQETGNATDRSNDEMQSNPVKGNGSGVSQDGEADQR